MCCLQREDLTTAMRGGILRKHNRKAAVFHLCRMERLVCIRRYRLYSRHLRRHVRCDIYHPAWWHRHSGPALPLVLLHDGQDLPCMQYRAILRRLWRQEAVPPFVSVGIHASAKRLLEYGISGHPDYKRRGRRADRHARFVTDELWPWLQRRFRLLPQPRHHIAAGFSLGGLAAFDLAWHHPGMFGQVGIFSGSLWWRSRPWSPRAPNAHRIVHELVARDPLRPGLRFWFEAGTEDETSDRDGDGIIDAIDDTLDLIALLKARGYPERDIRYVEVPGGRHEPATWGQVMPDFLKWALGDLVEG